jgi:hypothetical protein
VLYGQEIEVQHFMRINLITVRRRQAPASVRFHRRAPAIDDEALLRVLHYPFSIWVSPEVLQRVGRLI